MPEAECSVAQDRSLALVLWGKNSAGDDDVVVYSGVLIVREGRPFLSRDAGDIELETDWLDRIRPVPQELRETLLGCEFQIALTIGDTGDTDTSNWRRLGIKWPV